MGAVMKHASLELLGRLRRKGALLLPIHLFCF
jgi:hypothetical protein